MVLVCLNCRLLLSTILSYPRGDGTSHIHPYPLSILFDNFKDFQAQADDLGFVVWKSKLSIFFFFFQEGMAHALCGMARGGDF